LTDEGLSMLLISHNLGVVRAMTDRLYVMYAGAVVEHGATAALFRDPAPSLYERAAAVRAAPRRVRPSSAAIAGTLPGLRAPARRAAASTRAARTPAQRCLERPPAFEVGPGHASRLLAGARAMQADARAATARAGERRPGEHGRRPYA
jgi:ABC-type dipeptide/oligopeptide/nickel transport system ATPase component